MRLTLRVGLAFLLVTFARAGGAQPLLSLAPIRDGFYQLKEGDQAAIVFVAQDGILIAGSLSDNAGRWLSAELVSRFPGKPVRYFVYASPEYARAAGAARFPKAIFVAHAHFNSDLVKARGGEPQGKTKIPLARNMVREHATLTIGSKRIDVINPRSGFPAPTLFFPDEKVLYFATDNALTPSGFSFGDAKPRDVVDWLHGLAALPVETVVTSHGEPASRDAVAALSRYADDLFAVATDAYSRGASVQQAADASTLQQYAGHPQDARRRSNIDAIFRSLRVTRTELQGAGFARWMSENKAYCEGYTNCVTGGQIIGGSAGLRIGMSHSGVIVEGAFGEQFASRREGEFDDEAYVQRSSRGSFLLRFGTNRPTAFSIDLLAGPTLIIAETRGVTRVKEAVAPFGGRHPIAERSTTVGATVGVNLVAPLTRAISVIVPLRATALTSEPFVRWPGRFDAQGGIGFSVRLTQHVR